MYRYILLIIVAVMCNVHLYAANPANYTLRGTVRDNNHQPLPGAVVEIPDLKTGTIADSNGNYVLGNIPRGRFIVVASLISYSKATVAVNIAADLQQDLVLNESAIEGHEVVITGQSKATEIKRSPVPVLVINNQYLKTEVSSNIIDAIARVPGVSQVSTGPNVSKPVIRGLGGNRILTLYNGMRQEGQQWGDEHGIEVDQYGIDRVELVKGPSSLIYGSDALGGVVNLIPTPHAADGKIAGEVMAEYQGNNGLAGGSGVLTGSKNGFYWLGRASHKQAHNYTDPVDGRVYATSYSESDLSASFGVNKKWGFSHLDMSLYDDIQAIPDGSRDSASRKFTKQITEADTVRPIVSDRELDDYTLPGLRQRVQHYRVQSSNSFHVGNSMLAVNAGFERSVRREYSHPELTDIAGLYLQLNALTYDVKYYLKSIAGWDITAGINGMYQANDVTAGTEFVIPSYHQFDIGPFFVFKKNIGKLDISGGVRFDTRMFQNDALYSKTDNVTGFEKAVSGADTLGSTRQFSNYQHTFSGLTYSLGFTYMISRQLAVKANVARGFRAPNISEISANGVHPGTLIYQLGNPDFKPEFSLQEDIGIEYTAEHISVNMAVFNNDISNYIYNKKVLNANGQDSVVVPGNQTFRYTAAGARLYGGELEIDIHPHPLDWLHFENSISVVYGVNKGVAGAALNDSEKYLPFIPAIHGVSELRGNFKHPAKHLKNSFLKVQLAMYSAQNRVYLANNTETSTPGYALFNAGCGTDICNNKGKQVFNISLFGNNLFNTAYQDHLSRPKYFEPYPTDPRGRYGIYNMGRNIGIRITVPLKI